MIWTNRCLLAQVLLPVMLVMVISGNAAAENSRTGMRTPLLTAAQVVTATLSTTAPEPVIESFTVTLDFGQPVTGFTTSSLALTNARVSNLYGLMTQNPISAGDMHSLALRTDGTVAAFGNNTSGQLNLPADLNGVIAVSAGSGHSLALKGDGTVVACGTDLYFIIQTYYPYPCVVPAGLSGVLAIASGANHSLALLRNGTLTGWGDPDSYLGGSGLIKNAVALAGGDRFTLALLADGTIALCGSYSSSVQTNIPDGLNGVIAIAAGSNHGLALRKDGTVMAWGNNDNGQCNVPAGLGRVVAVAAAGTYSLALRADGTVAGWGYNTYDLQNPPAGLNRVTALAAGTGHCLALRDDGSVVSWGRNDNGQRNLSAGTIVRQPAFSRFIFTVTPLAPGPLTVQAPAGAGNGAATGVASQASNILQRNCVAAGSLKVTIQPAAAVTAGAQWRRVGTTAWFDSGATEANIYPGDTQVELKDLRLNGWNAPANLNATVNIGSLTARQAQYDKPPLTVTLSSPGGDSVVDPFPVMVDFSAPASGLTTASLALVNARASAPRGIASLPSLAAGWYHCLVLRPDGTVAAWGSNTKGQCNVPVGLSGVVAVAAGPYISLALKGDGSVVAWGDDAYKQCQVPAGLSGVVAVAAGMYHCLALKADGSMAVWGDITHGQDRVPAGLTGVRAIAAGDYYSLALRPDGTVTAWGNTWLNNVDGHLPDLDHVIALATGQWNDLALRSDGTIAEIDHYAGADGNNYAGLAGVVGIANGYDHYLALNADGTVVAGGSNGYGQCNVPAGLSGVVAVAAGRAFSLALKADGTLVGWGQNYVNGYLSGFTVPPGMTAHQPLFTRGLFYLTPLALGPLSAQVTAGAAVNLAGTPSLASNILTRNCATPGGLAVTLDPADAVAAGARWRRSGTVSWYDSAATETRVPPGPAVVEFKPVADWVTPTTRTVAIVSNQTAQTSGTYVYQFGGLGVTITPPGAVADGAQWRRAGTTTWLNSGTTETRTPIGNPKVEFKEIVNGIWDRPADTSVAIKSKATTALRVHYDLKPVTATLSSTAGSSVAGTFRVTAAFSQPVLGFTTAGLALVNARAAHVEPLTVQNSMAAGQGHTLALRPDGTVAAWGSNANNQCNVPAGLTGVTAVAAGDAHSLALKADGTVIGWGADSDDQCTIPYGLASVVAIAAGGNHSLALRADGTVAAWGRNDRGQSTVPAGLGGVTAIAAGTYHSLALKTDGTVVAWGNNSSGECNPPTDMAGVIAISAGWGYSLALKSDGTVVAWGGNSYGQCTVPAGLTGVVAIAAGYDTILALKADGAVIGWGRDQYGQADAPAGTGGIVAIGAGSIHSLMLRADGTMAVVGSNAQGQGNVPGGLLLRQQAAMRFVFDLTPLALGPVSAQARGGAAASMMGVLTKPSNMLRWTMTKPAALKVTILPAAAVVAGARWRPVGKTAWQPSGSTDGDLAPGNVTLELLELSPMGWNRPPNPSVRLTAGTTSTLTVRYDAQPVTVTLASAAGNPVSEPFRATADFSKPVLALSTASLALTNARISNLRPLTIQNSLAGGNYHTLALCPDGTVVAWGDNDSGQCNVPPGLGGVVAVAAGGYHSLALKADGTVVAWGASDSGLNTVPASAHDIVSISAGYLFNLALRSDGTVIAWGSNISGQCTVPADLTGVIAIAAGSQHSMALRSDGTVVVWGSNNSDECHLPYGLADVVSISTGGVYDLAVRSDGSVATWGTIYGGGKGVAMPANLHDVVMEGTGFAHQVTVSSDGTIAAWGANDYGQCDVPPGLTGVVGLASGIYHNLALKADGTVVSWGSNDKGQCDVPAGLVVRRPAFTHCQFTLTPLASGPLAVQVPAGAASCAWGAQLQASNSLQRNAQVQGSLKVTIAPPEAVAAGAQWRRVGTATWLASGATESGVPVGTAQVEFKSVSWWQTPARQAVTILNARTAALSAAYTGYLNLERTSPAVIAVLPGKSATFQAAASGTPAITYQWRKNGTPIPGATAASYTLSACRGADEALYTCLARSPYAAAESEGIRLVVNGGGGVISYLLGLGGSASGLDLNQDGQVDIGDALQGVWATPPDTPGAPFPASGTTGMGLKLRLNWADCGRALGYDVYVWEAGTSRPTRPTAAGLTLSQYDVTGGLTNQATYQWQVIARGAQTQAAGPVWQFSTN